MYFLRLTKLKPAVEEIAAEAWNGLQISDEEVEKVDRVLDVRQGKLCWVAGTIYMHMPLKPNILEDIAKDVCLFQKKYDRNSGLIDHSIGFQHRPLYKSTHQPQEKML